MVRSREQLILKLMGDRKLRLWEDSAGKVKMC